MAGGRKPIMEVTFGDMAESLGGGGLCCSGCLSVVTLVLVILFFPCTVQQLGQKKLGLVRNTLTGEVDLDHTFAPGRYWIGFWKEFIEFPSTLNTIEFSDDTPEEGVQDLAVLRSRDRDGKQIYLDVSIQYQLFSDTVGQLYREMTTLYEDVYISALRDALSKVGNEFPISLAWENYTEVKTMMKQACVRELAARHANCWDLQLWRVRLEERYENALVRTQVAKQAQHTEQARLNASRVRAQTQVLLAGYRRNVTVLNSTGEAQYYQIERAARATAEANTINAQAEALRAVRELVRLNTSDAASMTEEDLVQYQKYVMLQESSTSHFVYNQGVEVRNANGASGIMSRSRRLDDTDLAQEL